MKNLLIVALATMAFSIQTSQAQRTTHHLQTFKELVNAEQLIQDGLYKDAYHKLSDFLFQRSDSLWIGQGGELDKAYFLFLQCAIQTNQYQAGKRIEQFVRNTNNAKYKQLGHQYLANYFFQTNQFEKAIEQYMESDMNFMTNDEIVRKNFQLGYSYLITQQFEKATTYFQSIQGIDNNRYAADGNYYHGILAYYNKDYVHAKENFLKIAQDSKYQSVVPFYLTEIEYLEGHKQLALDKALAQLKAKDAWYFQNELNNMVGQIYFENEEYEKAAKHFDTYIKQNEYPNQNDYYHLAYAYYQQGDIDNAILNLNKIPSGDNLVSQHSDYLLANCYLKLGKKEEALAAYGNCMNKHQNESWNEYAHFTTGKLYYDMNNEEQASKWLNLFIKKYPNSIYTNEANELLAYIYIKNERFDDGIKVIHNMSDASSSLKKVYQKANYARGLQMLKEGVSDKAFEYFLESNKYNIDHDVATSTAFWQAESMYRLGRYDDALIYANHFLNQVDDFSQNEKQQQTHLLKSYIHEKLDQHDFAISEYNLYDKAAPKKEIDSLLNLGKPDFVPYNIPIVSHDAYALVYAQPEQKILFQYAPVQLKPIAMQANPNIHGFENYFELGLGSMRTIKTSAGYDASALVNHPLYFHIHSSSNKANRTFKNSSNNVLGVYTNLSFINHLIESSFTIERNVYGYYGYDRTRYDYSLSDLYQRFVDVAIKANIIQQQSNKWNIQYKPSIQLGVFTDKNKTIEPRVAIDIPCNKMLNAKLNLLWGTTLDLNYRSSPSANAGTAMWQWQGGVQTQFEGANIRAVLKPTFAQEFHLLPDIKIDYPLNRYQLTLTAGLQGQLLLNNYKQQADINPFIYNTYTVKQTAHTDAYIAADGKLLNNVMYRGKMGLRFIKNFPLYINDTLSDMKQFNVLYDKSATAFLLDLSGEYLLDQNTQLGAGLRFQPILKLNTYANAWHYVPLEIDVHGSMQLMPKLKTNATMYVRSGSIVLAQQKTSNDYYTKTLNAGVDMNAGLQYAWKPRWTLMADVYNLFNSKYMRWNQYDMFGTYGVLGIRYKFNGYNPLN
ncbi:MAG: CDC27 family protein [Chitinophagaceae bacterium]